MAFSQPPIDNVKTVVVDSELHDRLLQQPAALIGLIQDAGAHVVAQVRVPPGSMSVKWVSAFVRQLAAMLPGGIVPIGILNAEADFTALLEFNIEQSKLKCRRHSRTSRINITVKPQSKLTDSLHCFQTFVSICLPLSSLNPADFQPALSSWLEKSVPVLKDSKDLMISRTNPLPLSKLEARHHQIEFLLSTMQTRSDAAPAGFFSGAMTGIAYALPQDNLQNVAAALQADLIEHAVYRWNLFKDFTPDDTKTGACQLPKRVLFRDPDSQVYLCDYVFPDETLDEVNDRIQEYICLERALDSLDGSDEKFPPPDAIRKSPTQQRIDSGRDSKSTWTLPLVFVLLALIPLVIAVLFMFVSK